MVRIGVWLPLLILSFLAGGPQRQITQWLARHASAIHFGGGLLLVGIGVYDLSLSWDWISTLFQ